MGAAEVGFSSCALHVFPQASYTFRKNDITERRKHITQICLWAMNSKILLAIINHHYQIKYIIPGTMPSSQIISDLHDYHYLILFLILWTIMHNLLLNLKLLDCQQH